MSLAQKKLNVLFKLLNTLYLELDELWSKVDLNILIMCNS